MVIVCIHKLVSIMILILDGSSEIGANVRSNLFFYIFFIGSRVGTNPKRPIFPHACATSSELPSNISSTRYTGHGGMKENLNNAEYFNLFLPQDQSYKKNKV